MAWRCPECSRQFQRTNQGHECAPAMTVEEYFTTAPGFAVLDCERSVFEAVMNALADVGPVHVEPVSVGIFLKRASSFAQLRPMTKWVALSMSLPREVSHPTMTRKVQPYSGRYHHVFNLTSAGDVDERIAGWLAEAYLAAPE